MTTCCSGSIEAPALNIKVFDHLLLWLPHEDTSVTLYSKKGTLLIAVNSLII